MCALLLLHQLAVFGDSASDALSPHTKTGWLQICSHDFYHIGFTKAGALLDLIEGDSILPRHVNDWTDFLFGHVGGWITK